MASDMCFYCQVLAKLLVLDTDHNCRDGQERTPLIWAASYGRFNIVLTMKCFTMIFDIA